MSAAETRQDHGTRPVLLHGGPGAGREVQVFGATVGICYTAGSALATHYSLFGDVFIYVGACAWVHPGWSAGGPDA